MVQSAIQCKTRSAKCKTVNSALKVVSELCTLHYALKRTLR